MNNAQTPKQKLSESLQQVCQQLWEQSRTVFVTKQEESVALANAVNALQDQVNAVKALQAVNNSIEGYIRVAGVSDPALSYKAYARQSEFGASWRSIFYPCLIGTMLTGSSTVGQILHVLKKLGARTATSSDTGFTVGQAVWEDLEGTPHAIDGSEGDVMITNIVPYYMISGHYTVNGTEFDIFLRSLEEFEYNDLTVEKVEPFGDSPDYCVSHQDTDGVTRMHSVYNPAWAGSYSAPVGVAGRYIQAVDAETGGITETFDGDATVLGGSGGLHTTGLALYTGEQQAMNLNVDTTKTTPWMNKTARGAELLWANLAAEGGTFDSHKAALFGSGFCANDGATAAADWTEDATGAKNGVRIADKDGAWKYYSLGGNVRCLTGQSDTLRSCNLCNGYRSPWHIMEAYRALSHAVANGVGELEWFVFEGNRYKWRSVEGYDGPAQGEATAVVWKLVAMQAGASAVDPTDMETSIAGNRVEMLVSTGLYHGMTTQVSPSWWTSGLLFTEDENQGYEAYMQRDQASLILSEDGEKLTSEDFSFETLYDHVGTFTGGGDFRKNYSNDCLMLPDSDANRSGAALHTYVGAYNNFAGGAASVGKKSVRGFRRGGYAGGTNLSPLFVLAGVAPSYSSSLLAFGTCVAIVEV